MSKREKVLAEYKIIDNPEVNALRLKLYYHEGGYSFATGAIQARGLYLSCSPLHVRYEDGLVVTGYRGFSGTKLHVKEMGRFSQKTLDNFQPTQSDIDKLIEHVVTRNNLTVEGI